MIWSLLVWAAFGLVTAFIAKAIMPGKDPGGFIINIIIGVVGAIIGGYLSQFLGFSNDGEVSFLSPKDWIFSVIGGLIVLYLWRKVIAPNIKK